MPSGGRVALRLVTSGFGVDEARSCFQFPVDFRRLQDMQAAARRLLRERLRALQALDAQLEEKSVLVSERVLEVRILLAMHRRHPVVTVVGKQLVPFVEAFFVQQARFPDHESDEILVGHPAVMSSRQARNWLRMARSLVPLATFSRSSRSEES